VSANQKRAARRPKRKTCESNIVALKSSRSAPINAQQDVQVKPVPDTSTVAAFVPLDAVETVDPPVLVLPTEIRQMIFSYLLPSEKHLLFPPQGKAKQAQLAQCLSGIHMRRSLIHQKGISIALLQVRRRFRAEALPTLIRLNTILILVLEEIDVQRTSFSSMHPYHWTHVPNIAVKMITHNRRVCICHKSIV
jgi:hypothetical protein